MRFLAIAIMAAAVAVVSSPAAAAWTEVVHEDLGLRKEWPGEPARATVEFKTPVAGTAMAQELTYEADNIVYRMTVVPLANKLEASASIFGECIFMAEDAGIPVAEMTARVEPGARAVYGRIISVDLRDNKGRAMTACFFTKGNLYKLEAIVKPEHGEPNSSLAIRFINSLSFNMAGERE